MADLLSIAPFVGFFLVFAFVAQRVFRLWAGSRSLEEKMIGGPVHTDHGVISTRKRGITTITHSLMQADIDGVDHLVLKSEYAAPLGWSVKFVMLPPEAQDKLREVLG